MRPDLEFIHGFFRTLLKRRQLEHGATDVPMARQATDDGDPDFAAVG